jgi:hypothetical protein
MSYLSCYCVVTGGTLVLSVLYFYLPVYGGVHWFNGPVSTINLKDNIIDGKDVDDKETFEN